MSLARFNITRALAFPNPLLWAQTVSLLVDTSLLPLLAHYFLDVTLVRISLYYVSVLVRSSMKVAGYFLLNFCTSRWTVLELEAKSCFSAICLAPSSHNPELHSVVMAAKAVPGLQIHKTETFKSLKCSDCSSCGRERSECWCFPIIVKSCFYFFIRLEILSFLGHAKWIQSSRLQVVFIADKCSGCIISPKRWFSFMYLL